MTERVVDYNPLTGETVLFKFNDAEDSFTLVHQQDVEPILEANKSAMLDSDAHRRQSKNEWAHYASVPNIVQLIWLQQYGVNFNDKNHWPKVMKLLNDPEWRYLKRTTYTHDR